MSNRCFDRSSGRRAGHRGLSGVGGICGLAGLAFAVALSGCVNVQQQGAGADVAASGAPVASAPVAAAPAAAASGVAVVAQNAAAHATESKATPPPAVVKPATYRVRRGDTLKRIAQKHNVTVKQLAAWNRIKVSARVKPGQTLVVSSPEAARNATAAAASAPASSSSASIASSTPPAADAASAGAPQQSQQSSAASAEPPTPEEVHQVTAALARHANGVALAWPAQGNVVEQFQPGETRGIEIGGKPGDPVRAAADGKVMYAGTGLNEYGSLIIVQHNKDFLTAYSHNRKLLVKTGDVVRQGQQIAEMGSENNSRVSVGFELRRDGKPIDPMPYLPHNRG
ncbi:peptidoglycan DD-metalloendopeptidase family protein [Paraburkholderia sp. SARCC-3016]|uniref:peptidoglycan DD-metalloendopeptidase family protein n=1 Tax=Paraburkholderia sp. SARCC-3016 TaxID=3058611 RepID=UPI0028074222|nr:peptidoglycan DD-metalloendopeptidase family protein [Paraburkholderia sp. SARCC-3016]MDQ7980491.1 peptidoglycan DD-metalloendopeptidase family protein [Paraburkholderia sp. SARCC-3016]